MAQRRPSLILSDIRSAHNVGAIFRSADAFGVSEIILTGITPYPIIKNDTRLPHVRDKAHQMIAKTALGAEKTVPFKYVASTEQAIAQLKARGYNVYALEQAANSVSLATFKPQAPCALIVGNEVKGLSPKTLKQSDQILEITQFGRKESLNVAVATGIALFGLTNALSKQHRAAS